MLPATRLDPTGGPAVVDADHHNFMPIVRDFRTSYSLARVDPADA